MANKNLKWWLIGGAILLSGGLFVATKTGNRGIDNNNPGNIRLTNIAWAGKVPNSQNNDGEFEQFYKLEYGVRALIKNMITHINGNAKTLPKLIAIWAPASENDTAAYIASVSRQTGIQDFEVLLPTKQYLKPLAKAIAKHETGKDIITDQMFETAWSLI